MSSQELLLTKLRGVAGLLASVEECLGTLWNEEQFSQNSHKPVQELVDLAAVLDILPKALVSYPAGRPVRRPRFL